EAKPEAATFSFAHPAALPLPASNFQLCFQLPASKLRFRLQTFWRRPCTTAPAEKSHMALNAADVLVDRLIDWDVRVVFGLPGDGINGIMEALRVRKDRIRFIQVRHEEAAAFMACAYGKYARRLGCCLATSGPGGIHLLNGLYDAKLDQSPVLAITGQTFSDLKGSN